jgi:hypothetical protein
VNNGKLHIPPPKINKGYFMRILLSAMLLAAFLAGCGHDHRRDVPPGHDPHGPGNSENAPGHNKDRYNDNRDRHDHHDHYDGHRDGPGNSENAPGHNKDR